MSSSERPDPPHVAECPCDEGEAAAARVAGEETGTDERSRTDGDPSSPPAPPGDVFLASVPASEAAEAVRVGRGLIRIRNPGEPDLVMTRGRLTQFISQLRGHEQQVVAIMHEMDRQVSSSDVADVDSEDDDDDDDVEADDDDEMDEEYLLNDDDEVDEEYVDAEEEEEQEGGGEREAGRTDMEQEDVHAKRQALLLADGPFAESLRLHTRAQDNLLRLAGGGARAGAGVGAGRVNVATMIYGRDVNASVSIGGLFRDSS